MPQGEIQPTQLSSTDYNKPIPTKVPEHSTWAYSFRYFNQIKYFGLDNSKRKWFVSLLERLKDLSRKNRTEVFSDKGTKDFYRYHEINWSSTGIPIKKSDLNWVDKTYLNNDDEFPFYQFTVSKANGRVVGFWNENHTIFYIVLLDPLHNLQPSKDFDYKVDDCYPLSCEYSSILHDIEEIRSKSTTCKNCNIKKELITVPKKLTQSNAIVGYLDDDFLEEYENISERFSISDILQYGIMAAMAELNN